VISMFRNLKIFRANTSNPYTKYSNWQVMISYPKNALRCYATLAKPRGYIICPVSRMSYCVKEVVTVSTRSDCGRSVDFPFDSLDITGRCVYRTCAAMCDPSVAKTFIDLRGKKQSRTIHCCNEDLCNNASGKNLSIIHSMIIIIAALILVIHSML
jgi:hypothetical protein